MHERRNFVLVILLVASFLWGFASWFVLGSDAGYLSTQRIGSLALTLGFAAWLVYALRFEDQLPDHLRQLLGEQFYYEAEGLSFMPTIRVQDDHAELDIFYQNRFENPVEAIVHLRPLEESFVIRPGMRDVHIAFKAEGGDFGVIRQPIAVPRDLQGEVINVQLAAAAYYPRSRGARLRRREGMRCGSLLVDWGGAAFKTGVHEVSGEMELNNPATLHLSMPVGVAAEPGMATWRQERIAGVQ